jgi:hypothetical protein
MATGIDLTGLTLNPIEVQDIKDFIIERVFERPEFQAIHGRFETGIKMQTQIVFASQFGKTGLKKAAACTRQTSSPESTLTQKYWNPVGIEDTLVVCAAELDGLFKAYFSKIQSYRDLYDITGSDLEIFYAILLEESMVQTIWRAAWFGDTTVAVSSETQATVTCIDNPLLVITAVPAGTYGNGITFEISDVAAGAASITVTGTHLDVALTGAAKTIADLQALIAATPAAAALITASGAGATVLIVEDPLVTTVGGTDTPGLVSAADVKFYDYFDGLWEQIFDAVAATTMQRVTITENATISSKSAQLALAANAATGYFKLVDAASDSRLRSDPNAQMLVTRELFENYLLELETAGQAYDINITQDGLPSLKWRGYNVVNMETIWGLSSRDDFENNTDGLAYYLPHRIVFTVPNNIPLGTLNENDFTELEQWYNVDERQNKTAYGFTLDAKELEEYMIVVAY